ncbi:MAG: hypothetical protein ACO3G4_11190, partial [Opitutaceae bacterium]
MDGQATEEQRDAAPPPKVRIKRALIELSFKAGEERLAAAPEQMRREVRDEFAHVDTRSPID